MRRDPAAALSGHEGDHLAKMPANTPSPTINVWAINMMATMLFFLMKIHARGRQEVEEQFVPLNHEIRAFYAENMRGL